MRTPPPERRNSTKWSEKRNVWSNGTTTVYLRVSRNILDRCDQRIWYADHTSASAWINFGRQASKGQGRGRGRPEGPLPSAVQRPQGLFPFAISDRTFRAMTG